MKIIDCDSCVMRDIACDDCVVTVVLSMPTVRGAAYVDGELVDEQAEAAQAGSFDESEAAALAVLANSGLVPPLRLVPLRSA